MNTTLKTEYLVEYIKNQCNNFFPDNNLISVAEIKNCIQRALDRTEYSFSHIKLKYYNIDNNVCFNHLNSEHYAMFLWFLSNEAYLNGNINLAEKLFYLNKALNGLDAFYSIKLPDIFLLVHPVGSVIGNAKYQNYLIVYQNCTIGSSGNIYPVLGEGVTLYANSKIIGNCHIGNNVTLSAISAVVNEDVPDNTLVFGQSKNLIFKKEKIKEKERVFIID